MHNSDVILWNEPVVLLRLASSSFEIFCITVKRMVLPSIGDQRFGLNCVEVLSHIVAAAPMYVCMYGWMDRKQMDG